MSASNETAANAPNANPPRIIPACNDVIEVLSTGSSSPSDFVRDAYVRRTHCANHKNPANSGEYHFQVRNMSLTDVENVPIPTGYERISITDVAAKPEKPTSVAHVKVVLRRL